MGTTTHKHMGGKHSYLGVRNKSNCEIIIVLNQTLWVLLIIFYLINTITAWRLDFCTVLLYCILLDSYYGNISTVKAAVIGHAL